MADAGKMLSEIGCALDDDVFTDSEKERVLELVNKVLTDLAILREHLLSDLSVKEV